MKNLINWKLPLIAGAFLVSSLFTNYSKAQTVSSFVDSVMAKSNEYPTTTHLLYDMVKDTDFYHNTDKLDSIIACVEKKFPKKEQYSGKEAREIMEVTSQEIRNNGLEYKAGKTSCFAFSLIHLAVGEKFNFPLYCVVAKNHMFIRYDPDGKHDALKPDTLINKGDFIYETVGGWGVKYDEFYIRWLKISDKDIKDGTYMRNLTKEDLIMEVLFFSGKLGKLFF